MWTIASETSDNNAAKQPQSIFSFLLDVKNSLLLYEVLSSTLLNKRLFRYQSSTYARHSA